LADDEGINVRCRRSDGVAKRCFVVINEEEEPDAARSLGSIERKIRRALSAHAFRGYERKRKLQRELPPLAFLLRDKCVLRESFEFFFSNAFRRALNFDGLTTATTATAPLALSLSLSLSLWLLAGLSLHFHLSLLARVIEHRSCTLQPAGTN